MAERWEEMWHVPVDELRARYAIEPVATEAATRLPSRGGVAVRTSSVVAAVNECA
jgi:hypothetical protein